MRVRARRARWSGVVGSVFLVTGVAAAVPVPKTLEARLAAAAKGDVLRVPAGELAGPLVVPPGVTLEGEAGARVVARVGAGVTLSEGAVLRGLAVSGEPAVLVPAGVHAVVDQVRATGGVTAVRVEPGGTVELRGSTTACTFTGATKEGSERPVSLLANGAVVRATGTTFGTGCARAIAVSGGEISLTHVKLVARETGIRGLDTEVTLEDVTVDIAARESSAGMYLARSRSRFAGVRVRGGEQGLLLRSGRTEVDGFETSGNLDAGVALVGGAATLRHVKATGPFGGAAISASDAVLLEVFDSTVVSAGLRGIASLRTTLRVKGVRVSGARRESAGDFGHGVMAVEGEASVEDLDVSDCEGTAVWVQHADGRGDRLRVSSSAAAWVQLDGNATVDGLVVERDVRLGLLAAERASVRVAGGRLGSETGVMQCAGARIVLEPAVRAESRTPSVECGDADLSRPLPARPR